MIRSKINRELYLDVLTHNESSKLNRVRNMPRIRDWCRQVGLIDDIQQSKWLERISSDNSIRMYGIFKENDPTSMLLGVCGLTDIDHVNQRAEFSLYIFPKYHKNGYGKQALITLFNHGFNDLNLKTIYGETFDGNNAIVLFLETLLMNYDGTRPNFYFKNGKFLDSHMISMDIDEWKTREYADFRDTGVDAAVYHPDFAGKRGLCFKKTKKTESDTDDT